MKIKFDDLDLIETKILVDVLIAFRSGQPFSHPGRVGQPQLVKDPELPKP